MKNSAIFWVQHKQSQQFFLFPDIQKNTDLVSFSSRVISAFTIHKLIDLETASKKCYWDVKMSKESEHSEIERKQNTMYKKQNKQKTAYI